MTTNTADVRDLDVSRLVVDVASASDPGTVHEVAVLDGRAVGCTCRGSKYRSTCHHRDHVNTAIDHARWLTEHAQRP